MQLKIYRYTIVAYGAVLLLSLMLFYLFPKEALLDFDPRAGAGIEQDTYLELHKKWASGELDRKDNLAPYRKWHFDYDGGHLKIVSGGGCTPQILVKRTAADTSAITVAEYRLFRGDFFEDELNPYTVDLVGERLIVRGPEQIALKFRGFERDFTIDQFREKRAGQYQEQDWDSPTSRFIQGLYLYIPETVKIDYDPGDIFILPDDEE